jgi:hypothetical protein
MPDSATHNSQAALEQGNSRLSPLPRSLHTLTYISHTQAEYRGLRCINRSSEPQHTPWESLGTQQDTVAPQRHAHTHTHTPV